MRNPTDSQNDPQLGQVNVLVNFGADTYFYNPASNEFKTSPHFNDNNEPSFIIRMDKIVTHARDRTETRPSTSREALGVTSSLAVMRAVDAETPVDTDNPHLAEKFPSKNDSSAQLTLNLINCFSGHTPLLLKPSGIQPIEQKQQTRPAINKTTYDSCMEILRNRLAIAKQKVKVGITDLEKEPLLTRFSNLTLGTAMLLTDDDNAVRLSFERAIKGTALDGLSNSIALEKKNIAASHALLVLLTISQGVVNNDTQPGNAMRLENGEIQLIDTGTSVTLRDNETLADYLSHTSVVGFMAPISNLYKKLTKDITGVTNEALKSETFKILVTMLAEIMTDPKPFDNNGPLCFTMGLSLEDATSKLKVAAQLTAPSGENSEHATNIIKLILQTATGRVEPEKTGSEPFSAKQAYAATLALAASLLPENKTAQDRSTLRHLNKSQEEDRKATFPLPILDTATAETDELEAIDVDKAVDFCEKAIQEFTLHEHWDRDGINAAKLTNTYALVMNAAKAQGKTDKKTQNFIHHILLQQYLSKLASHFLNTPAENEQPKKPDTLTLTPLEETLVKRFTTFAENGKNNEGSKVGVQDYLSAVKSQGIYAMASTPEQLNNCLHQPTRKLMRNESYQAVIIIVLTLLGVIPGLIAAAIFCAAKKTERTRRAEGLSRKACSIFKERTEQDSSDTSENTEHTENGHSN